MSNEMADADIYAFGLMGPRAIKVIEADGTEHPIFIGATDVRTGLHIYASQLPGAMGDVIRQEMIKRGISVPSMFRAS